MPQRTIGLRIKPKEVYYSIFEKTDDEITHLITDKIIVPKVLDLPQKLKFIRSTVLDVINQYEVDFAGIRLAEMPAGGAKVDPLRLAIEAVIQEGLASSKVVSYYTGRINVIASRIKIPVTHFKEYVSNERSYDSIENWSKYTLEMREAMFTSLGCFE